MEDNILIGRAGLDECSRTIGRQHVVPQVDQVVRYFHSAQLRSGDSYMMQARHQFAVVFGHGWAQQVTRASFLQELKNEKENWWEQAIHCRCDFLFVPCQSRPVVPPVSNNPVAMQLAMVRQVSVLRVAYRSWSFLAGILWSSENNRSLYCHKMIKKEMAFRARHRWEDVG